MAAGARILFLNCIICIWFALANCQTLTDRTSDYEELSKAVDRFLDILVKDTSDQDNRLSSWANVPDTNINPKLKILAHVLRYVRANPDVPAFTDQLNPSDYILSFLQPLESDEEVYLDDTSELPNINSPEFDQLMNNAKNSFWPKSNDDTFSEQPEKKNGIWYGKRLADSENEEPEKRNGIWYGKRTVQQPAETKRNGIWYGKRNGIWYGKRNGIWYGKRGAGLYSKNSDEMM